MKKIALEEHYMPPVLLESFQNTASGFDKQAIARLIPLLTDFDGPRLEAMDQAGIDLCVLSIGNAGAQGERSAVTAIPHAREANDFLAAQIRKRPDRYRGFAHLPMQDPRAAAESCRRTVRDLGFLGAVISTNVHGHCLDEERYLPFLERVAELDVPVYLHPVNAYQLPQSFQDHPELVGPIWGWTVDAATHALRLVFAGVFDRFPNLKIILGPWEKRFPFSYGASMRVTRLSETSGSSRNRLRNI